MNRRILEVSGLFALVFLLLIAYLSYLQFFKSEALANNPANRRLLTWEEKVERGGIFTSDDEILAVTQNKDNGFTRVYPKGNFAAHLVGYNSSVLGQSGLEAALAGELLGRTGFSMINNRLKLMAGQKGSGNNIILTIDSRYQKLAEQLLEEKRGAVVVIDSSNGELLAVSSAPGFNPNNIEQQWQHLNSEDQESPILNRALNGSYAPGSSFKVVTMAAGLRLDKKLTEKEFQCPGYIKIDGRILRDNAIHGRIGLEEALAVSCNVTFAQLGLEVGQQNLLSTAESFGFGQSIPLVLPTKAASLFEPRLDISKNALAEAAIGQGTVTASPLQMALIAAAVSNQGIIMKPYLLKRIETFSGEIIKKNIPTKWLVPLKRNEADIITNAMKQAVSGGTAVRAGVEELFVAGKTGTAQNSIGRPHSWFIGFAREGSKTIALSIIIENAGSGGDAAAAAAQEIFQLFKLANK